MAIYRAISNGNFSNLAIWQDNGGGSFAASTVLPGINDNVYANARTVTIDTSITVNSLRNHITTGISNNGGFVVNANSLIISAISYIGANSQTTAVNTLTINSDNCSVLTQTIVSGDAGFADGIRFTGTGSLSVTCLTSIGANANGHGVNNSGTGTLNFTGQPIGGTAAASAGIANSSTGTLYVTGIPLGHSGIQVGGAGARNNSTGSLYITGGSTSGTKKPGVESTTNGYIKIIGPITATEQPGFTSTGVNAINILSGPFISGPTGIAPFNCFRVHYEITTGSYYEFRDSSTNGAGIAPATQLVAPGTAVDSPDEADVRQGINYAFNTLTGSLIVPSPSNVRKDVPTDNTVGTADLTASDIWNYLSSNATTVGSIGKQIVDNLDATITSRATQTSVDNIVVDFTPVLDQLDDIEDKIDIIDVNVDNIPVDILDEITNSTDPIAIRLRNVSTVETTGTTIANYNV